MNSFTSANIFSATPSFSITEFNVRLRCVLRLQNKSQLIVTSEGMNNDRICSAGEIMLDY